MTNISTKDVLSQGADAFKSARQDVLEGARLLYLISKEELWKERFDSFEAYVEDECKIGKSFASKLVQIWQNYVVDGCLAAKQLEGVDTEKLYLALQLPGGADKKLAQAQTLSRQELRQELRDPDDACEHPNQGLYCKSCHKTLS